MAQETNGCGGVTINIDELHIHLEERTEIHNLYPDLDGGLEEKKEDAGETFDIRQIAEDIERLLKAKESRKEGSA